MVYASAAASKLELELPETMDRLPPEHELAASSVWLRKTLTNVHRHSKTPVGGDHNDCSSSTTR